MISVIASIHIKDGRKDEFLQAFKANVPNVLNEDGCIEYVPMFDALTTLPAQERADDVVTVVEKWDSLECLEAHLSAPHMLTFRDKVQDIVETVSLKILQQA